MELFHELHEKSGTTLVVVTHDPAVGAQCTRRVVLKDGEIDVDVRQTKARAAKA
jgi:putative ABC transport system ATP-binding protein